jgi:CxxC motif-containing protein (DUF1111 family)
MKALAATLVVSSACAATGAWATGELDAVLGKALFERAWVSAPASTDASDGLGPLFSAKSCAGCHAGPSLAARFTETGDGKIAGRGLVIRFGDSEGNPDPLYGHLLQNQAVQGLAPEGRAVLTSVGGGESGYDLSLALDRGPLDPATHRSTRVAPPLVGRAMLESIDAGAVLALADPEDRDGDGVSGRVRMFDRDGREKIGRYGWKAGIATVEEQVADAFAREIGLSSARRPLPHGDCTAREPDCLAAPTGESALLEGHELSEETIGVVTAFVASLDAPRRDEERLQAATKFAALGCAACHVPSLPDAQGRPMSVYSDLLLHDMGEKLDDGVGETGVASAEWRTAPLIAMSEGGGRRYLHDGRAATIDAAIRAHGGEAEAARARYESVSESERRALLDFIEKL